MLNIDCHVKLPQRHVTPSHIRSTKFNTLAGTDARSVPSPVPMYTKWVQLLARLMINAKTVHVIYNYTCAKCTRACSVFNWNSFTVLTWIFLNLALYTATFTLNLMIPMLVAKIAKFNTRN